MNQKTVCINQPIGEVNDYSLGSLPGNMSVKDTLPSSRCIQVQVALTSVIHKSAPLSSTGPASSGDSAEIGKPDK